MAKPFLDRAGNGFHVHFSLLDRDGRNVFDNGTADGSETMRHAVGGVLSLMRASSLVFAPHRNSYRRLTPNAHVASEVTWGYETRAAAVRIPGGVERGAADRAPGGGGGRQPVPGAGGDARGGARGDGERDRAAGADGDAPGGWRCRSTGSGDRRLRAQREHRRGSSRRSCARRFLGMKKQELQVFSQQISPFEHETYLWRPSDADSQLVASDPTRAVASAGAAILGRRDMTAQARTLSASYYAATADPAPARPALAGERRPRSASSGRGSPGCRRRSSWPSAGTRSWCSRRARVGWGASGRNGGQIVNGLNAGLDTIARRYGEATAGFVATRGAGGRADHPRAGGALRHRLRPQGRQRLRGADAGAPARAGGEAGALAALRASTTSRCSTGPGSGGTSGASSTSGGMLDRTGGHMHPLNLALGAGGGARGARRGHPRGEPGHRRSTTSAGGRWCGRRSGTVRPEALILAGNAYLGHVVPALENRVMPFSTQMHGDRAARGGGGGRAADRRLRRGRALRPRLLPAVGGRAAALRRRHGLRRHRSGGHPGEAGAEPRAGLSAAQGRADRLRLVGQLRDLVQPGAAARAARAAPPTSRRATAGTAWSGSHLFGRILAEAVARRPVALRRLRRRARGCRSRAAGASPCPIPCSARGGMACAIASACEPNSSTGKV